MSNNAFDPYGEPPRRAPRSGDSSGWRAFDGDQYAAPASPSPPHGRRRNPYAPEGEADSGPRRRLMMDEPPSVEAPSLWPPVPEPSPPRMGAGLRTYTEPATEQTPTLRPQSRFREPTTSENMTIGQRPPSPYREYSTSETATVRPNSAPPSQRRPSRFDEPPGAMRPDSAPPFQRQAPDPTERIERQSFREPPTGETSAMRPSSAPPLRQESPPQRPYSSPPQSYAGDTATIDRQPPPFHEPPTTESAAVRPGSAPPAGDFGYGPPAAGNPGFGQPPHLADTATIDRQPPFGYEAPQRTIQVEPDTGSLATPQLAGAPADPPWQSRRAAEEDASYISPIRVLGTVGVLIVVLAMAGVVIWGLNLYGDRF